MSESRKVRTTLQYDPSWRILEQLRVFAGFQRLEQSVTKFVSTTIIPDTNELDVTSQHKLERQF